MATVIKSTLKASGGDYSSIKDWIDDMLLLYPNLVLLDVILELECYNDWPAGLDESFVDFKSGFTTDADHFLRLITPTSERHTGVAGTGFWFNTSSTGLVFYSRNQHVVFDGIESSAPSASQSMFGTSVNTIVKNCILHSIDSTGFSTTSGAKFENCVVYLTALSSSGNVGKAFHGSTLDNITAYISPDSGAFNGDIIFQNCICNNVYMFHNHAKTTYDSFFGGSGDYNVGLAINGDLPGANSFYIADDSDLVDPDNFDFRIKSTSPLATAGSGGSRIGAYYEESAGTGVTTDVDIELSQPEFSVIASAELPEPVSTLNIELSVPLFNVSASAELPHPIANIDTAILRPLFSIASNVSLPLPVANVSTVINAPLFSISTSTGLPQPTSNVSIELSSPLFSVEASTDLPAPQSNASFYISQPVFSISATSEALIVTLDADIDINAPLFSVNAETTTPVFSDASFNIESPSFSVESSVTIPDAVANVDIDISRPSFNVTMQISGVNIVIPKTGSSITYNPGLNSLVYYVGRNSLTYQPKSNSIKY